MLTATHPLWEYVLMGYDTEAIAILLKQTRNRDIRWAAVDLSSDGIPGG